MDWFLWAGIGMAVFFFLLFLVLLILHVSLRKKYNRFMHGLGEVDVERLMHQYATNLHNLQKHVEEQTERRILAIEKKMPTVLRNVGMVSYNAFEHMGNLMSFSAAALDDNQTGFVLTGIYSRDSSYMYAKAIVDGVPDKELSKEEKEACRKAMEYGKPSEPKE